MDDQECPRCKTTRYRNPALKLMVNVCGHSLCENCIDVLFVRGSGACPECGTAIRRNNFRLQIFENPFVEKEVDIRKRILKDFNKKEDEFSSLREYNDYLEMIENIVFNLVNGIDTEDTRLQIEQYKKENQDQIKKNRSKKSQEEEYLESLIEEEREQQEMYRRATQEEESKAQLDKRKNKKALIDELMFSDLPASHIVESHRSEIAAQKREQELEAAKPRITMFSTGIKVGKQDNYVPMPKVEPGVMYVYKPVHFETIGPDTPNDQEIFSDGYVNHLRETTEAEQGGGFHIVMACKRALMEGFNSLFFNPNLLHVQTDNEIEDVDMG